MRWLDRLRTVTIAFIRVILHTIPSLVITNPTVHLPVTSQDVIDTSLAFLTQEVCGVTTSRAVQLKCSTEIHILLMQ